MANLRIVVVFLMLCLFSLSGCSMKMLAVDVTADIMAEGVPVFEAEGDLELAEQAMGANLKVLEAMLQSDPENETLLTLLSKSYGGYTFAFVEDYFDQWNGKNFEKADYYKKRAGNFYLRGKEFGIRLLSAENETFREALNKDFQTFEASLEHFDEDDIEALFWTAYNWGNWVNMNLHEPEAIIAAPKVERMMNQVLERNETFSFAGPHLFYGVYLGGRPPMLGANREKAKMHFEKALKITQRKFLIAQVLYASYYAVQIQDKALFETLLNEVLDADANIFSEQNLITQLAKRKAERLLARKKDLFQ